MSKEVDFKCLWNKTSEEAPDTAELFKRAAKWRRIFRIKLLVQTITLMAIVIIMLVMGLNVDHRQTTTTAGLILMITGVVLYLIAINQLLPTLFKSNVENSTREYLDQMIRIKRNHEFVNRVMIDIYFGCLLVGVLLYGLQFIGTRSTFWNVCYHVAIIVALIATWIFSKAREHEKTLKPLNNIVKKMKEINVQLDSDGEK